MAVPALAVVIALAVFGGLASACFAKAFATSFLGEPRSDQARRAHESALALSSPTIVLARLCVIMALAAPWVVSFLGPLVGTIMTVVGIGGAEGMGDAAAQLEGQILLGLLALVAAPLVGRRLLLRRRKVRTGQTWGCGYSAPTPRKGARFWTCSLSKPVLPVQ
ncbi:MAG: hypothetical protein ACUVRY_06430, partial [Thermoanaerobaculaceae bacterium]